MTILTSFILVVAIIVVALFIAYNVQKGTKTLQEFKDDYYDNEEVQQVADLATELYNKDLRPIVATKEPLTKKSKKKIIESITNTGEYVAPKKKEVTSKDSTPEVIKKVLEVADIAPVNVEAVVDTIQTVEVVVEIPKPAKKKRKYYPRKK